MDVCVNLDAPFLFSSLRMTADTLEDEVGKQRYCG